jgi:hypothetical protein
VDDLGAHDCGDKPQPIPVGAANANKSNGNQKNSSRRNSSAAASDNSRLRSEIPPNQPLNNAPQVTPPAPVQPSPQPAPDRVIAEQPNVAVRPLSAAAVQSPANADEPEFKYKSDLAQNNQQPNAPVENVPMVAVANAEPQSIQITSNAPVNLDVHGNGNVPVVASSAQRSILSRLLSPAKMHQPSPLQRTLAAFVADDAVVSEIMPTIAAVSNQTSTISDDGGMRRRISRLLPNGGVVKAPSCTVRDVFPLGRALQSNLSSRWHSTISTDSQATPAAANANAAADTASSSLSWMMGQFGGSSA